MSAETQLLQELNEPQRRAVQSEARRLLIVAGAGSGKTEVVSRRIAREVGVRGTPRDQVVAFTFTEQAAEELQFRVRRHLAQIAVGEESDPTLGGMCVGTIHAFCIKALRELRPDTFHNFDVLDEGGRFSLVERHWYYLLGGPRLQKRFKEEEISRGHYDAIDRFLHAYDLLNEYHQLNVRLPGGSPPGPGKAEEAWCTQAKLLTRIGRGAAAEAFAETAARYYALLRCRRFLDFSTAQAEILRQVEIDDAIAEELRSRISHLVVDEVQDINPVQAELIEFLVGEKGQLTAVGDHRQAIFGWRGGRVQLMGDLHDDIAASKDGEVVGLDDNFRSTARIIELSNRWAETIAAPGGLSTSKMLHGRTERMDFEASHVGFIAFDEEQEEADWIAETVSGLVQGEQGAAHDAAEGERGLRRADVAILLRSTRSSRLFGDALRARSIPAVFRGSDLFGQPEVLLMVGVFARTVGLSEFLGGTIRGFIEDSLNCEPEPEPVIRAAAAELADRGIPTEPDLADRLLLLADLLHALIYEEERPAKDDLARLRSDAAKVLLAGKPPLRRVFPQALFHSYLEEASIGDVDALGSDGETVMFHLGAVSQLITSIETPGWTTPGNLKSQVIGLCIWGPQGARLAPADLLTSPDAVSIGTIHSSKGLQWPAVFVADIRARRFPSGMARRTPKLPFEGKLAKVINAAHLADTDNYDDERRLMYVALSRAERYLFLSASGSQESLFRKQLPSLVEEAGGVVAETPGALPGPLVLLEGHDDTEAQRIVSSFSDLRYYLECPHDFYLRKVLGFAPTIDQAFGYGRGVHNLMRAIHSDPARWSGLADKPDELETELNGLVDDGLFYMRYTTGPPLKNMREAAIRAVSDYVKTYSGELAKLTYEPEREFETLLEEEQVLISGAIDVVRRDDPPQVTLIDFKSGDTQEVNASKLDSEEMKLQVSLYGIAAKAEMEYEPERGLVRYLAETDPAKRELEVPLTPEALADAANTVARTARSIKNRVFHEGPAKPGLDGGPRCASCDFKVFCGVRRRQSLG